jgi:penicillin-binding protein 1A
MDEPQVPDTAAAPIPPEANEPPVVENKSNIFRRAAHWVWEHKKKISLYSAAVGFFLVSAISVGAYVSWRNKKQGVKKILASIEAELRGEMTARDQKPIEIYDRNGVLIGEMRRSGQRDIRGDNLKDFHAITWALLSSEDRNFHNHSGIQLKSIGRALHAMLTTGETQGGSTITQQLAKLLMSEAESAEEGLAGDTTKIRKRNIFNKLSEFFCTWYLEVNYKKETILALYLNKVYLGLNSVGFEDASRRYFGVSARNLTPAEAAMLVGIIPAPSVYNPAASMKRALARQQLVLKLMNQNPQLAGSVGKMEPEKEIQAFLQNHGVAERKVGEATIYASKIGKYVYARNFKTNRAPDFLNEVEKFLNKRYTSDDLKNRILRIDTTLDVRSQEAAADLLAQRVRALREELHKEKEKLMAKNNKPEADVVQIIEDGINGSYVGLNPTNAHIETLIGGFEYKSTSPINRAFTMYRQPGSTIKALVYAMAFEKKLIHPSSIVEDKAINIGGYHPKNWYKGFKGKITARQAFALSMNTIPVMLLQEIGISAFVEKMRLAMGLTSDEMALRIGDRKNLTMALGSIELSPLELARIYGTIASGGYHTEPVMILKISDFDGNAIYQADVTSARERILDPIACAMVMNLMQAVISPEGTMPIKSEEIKGISGGKSGTVQSPASAKSKWKNRSGIRDTWFVGALPQQISVIWVGHERGAPFTGSGGSTAGTVWKDFSKDYVQFHPGVNQLLPQLDSGYVALDICGEYGLILQSGYRCRYPVKKQVYYAENQQEISARTNAYVASLKPVLMGSEGGTATPRGAAVEISKPLNVDARELGNAGGVELEESPNEHLEMYQ